MAYEDYLGANIAYTTGAPRINPLAYTFGARSTFLAPTRPLTTAPRPTAPTQFTPFRPTTPVLRAPVAPKPVIRPTLKLVPTVKPPVVVPDSFASTGGGGGMFPSLAPTGGDGTTEESPTAALSKSPLLLIGVGVAALLFLNRKGR